MPKSEISKLVLY